MTDLIEDASYNLLIAAISDTKNSSDIEVYDVNKGAFSLIKRINFADVQTQVKQKIG